MRSTVYTWTFSAFIVIALLGASFVTGEVESNTESPPASDTKTGTSPQQPVAVGHPTLVSPHASPIAVSSGHVFVVNTPSDTVDVIKRETREIMARVHVGIDPVSLAARPDGKEVWVSNHVSDSVSVIDADAASPTYLQVIATIQDFDPETKATRFDEPMGIAFASNDKAYVALSSENQIAVINVATREVSKRLSIAAQEPRAIAVRGGRQEKPWKRSPQTLFVRATRTRNTNGLS